MSRATAVELCKTVPATVPARADTIRPFDLPPSILVFISSDMEQHHGAQSEIADKMMLIVKDLFQDDEKFPALS